MPSPSPSPYVSRHDYSCSWHHFRVGFMDWWTERMDPAKEAEYMARRSSKPLWAVALMAFALVFGLALVISMLGNTIASGMSLLGTQLVAGLAMGLLGISAISLFVGLPLWAAFKTWHFSQAMCKRGWELEMQLRKPYRR